MTKDGPLNIKKATIEKMTAEQKDRVKGLEETLKGLAVSAMPAFHVTNKRLQNELSRYRIALPPQVMLARRKIASAKSRGSPSGIVAKIFDEPAGILNPKKARTSSRNVKPVDRYTPS